MKKAILILAILSMGGFALAQKVKESAVPAPVKSGFVALYATDKVDNWKKEKGNYEASFMKDSKKMLVLFKPNGDWIETKAQIDASELPAPVTTYVKNNYPGQTIWDAYKITKSGGGDVNYKAEVGKMSLFFDAQGNFIKTEKEAGMSMLSR